MNTEQAIGEWVYNSMIQVYADMKLRLLLEQITECNIGDPLLEMLIEALKIKLKRGIKCED